MINQVYRLIDPRRIAAISVEEDLPTDKVVVRPLYLSICAADQRYFQGIRNKEVLRKKLPMALIHEAVGEVVYDPTGTFNLKDVVLLIPNEPTEEDEIIAENYLRSSKFRASGYDGFLQDIVTMKPSRLVKVTGDFNLETLSFSELVSVSYHAISRFKQYKKTNGSTIGVWGDGNLGYITALLLRTLLPDSKIYVFGKIDEKLQYFTFAHRTFNVDFVPEDIKIDHGFECVGGIGSQYAINQIIDIINPEGTISTLGVSEENIKVNTRMILEKGLLMIGSSRSGREDFEGVVRLYEDHPQIVTYFENLIGQTVTCKSISDIANAFNNDIKLEWGKTVLEWKK